MSNRIELAPMEGSPPPVEGRMDEIVVETPSGERLVFKSEALKRQKDDFGVLPTDEAAAEAALKAELAKKPTYQNTCNICRTVHAVEGDPICLCGKCGHLCRIVWCGQCVCCAYAGFADRFGEGVAERIYPQYAAYVHKQREEQAKENKMPWEK